jgi:hypothetical protein
MEKAAIQKNAAKGGLAKLCLNLSWGKLLPLGYLKFYIESEIYLLLSGYHSLLAAFFCKNKTLK